MAGDIKALRKKVDGNHQVDENGDNTFIYIYIYIYIYMYIYINLFKMFEKKKNIYIYIQT